MKKASVGIITQARFGSSRLPGKILKQAKNRPLLDYHLQRLKNTNLPVIVATTEEPEAEPITNICQHNSVPYFKGSLENVLQRFYQTAQQYPLEHIIRVTSDCPLIDSDLICQGVDYYFSNKSQPLYVGIDVEKSYARGVDFEIFSFETLEQSFHQAVSEYDKEHVTPYIYNNAKENNISIHNLSQNECHAHCYRLTLDTENDLALIRVLIEEFSAEELSYEEIISLLKAHPELAAINAPQLTSN